MYVYPRKNALLHLRTFAYLSPHRFSPFRVGLQIHMYMYICLRGSFILCYMVVCSLLGACFFAQVGAVFCILHGCSECSIWYIYTVALAWRLYWGIATTTTARWCWLEGLTAWCWCGGGLDWGQLTRSRVHHAGGGAPFQKRARDREENLLGQTKEIHI